MSNGNGTITLGRRSDGLITLLARDLTVSNHATIDLDDKNATWLRDELSKLLPRDPRLVAFDNFVEGFVKGLGSKDLEDLVASGILDPAQLSAFVTMIRFVMDEDLRENPQEKGQEQP